MINIVHAQNILIKLSTREEEEYEDGNFTESMEFCEMADNLRRAIKRYKEGRGMIMGDLEIIRLATKSKDEEAFKELYNEVMNRA